MNIVFSGYFKKNYIIILCFRRNLGKLTFFNSMLHLSSVSFSRNSFKRDLCDYYEITLKCMALKLMYNIKHKFTLPSLLLSQNLLRRRIQSLVDKNSRSKFSFNLLRDVVWPLDTKILSLRNI